MMIYWGKLKDDRNIPECRAIVVSRNTRDLLLRCLDSLCSQREDTSIEVVVADSGSTDGSVQMVRENFPGVRFVELNGNHGYAAAINRSAEGASSPYLLVMNSDAELQKGSIRELIATMEEHPSMAVCGPQLLNTDGSVQRSFNKRFPGLLNAVSYAAGTAPLMEVFYKVRWMRNVLAFLFWRSRKFRNVAWIGGACFLVRRDAFESLGGMDETFFLYSEDTDLCRRVMKNGYTVSYVPAAKVVHHWNSSIGKLSDAGFFSSLRSTLVYHRKHNPRIFTSVKILLGIGITIRLAAVTFALKFTRYSERFHYRTWLYWEALEMISGRPVREYLKQRVMNVYLPLRRVLLGVLFPFCVRRDGSEGFQKVKKILLLRYDGLGDAALTLPFVKILKRVYPRALIYVLAGERNSRLFTAAHDVYQVMETGDVNPRHLIGLVRKLRAEEFDLVIDPFVTHALGSAVLARLIGRRYRCGFSSFGRERFFNVISPEADADINVLDAMDSLARNIGWRGFDSNAEFDGSITLCSQEIRLVEEKLEQLGYLPGEPVLGIHPGGRYESQKWPLERFYRVALEVQERGAAKVILFQGKVWREGLELSDELPEGIVMLDDVELDRFMAMVKELTLLLCNNSGPLHVARALGVPTLSLTGPTRKAFLPVGSPHDWICETSLPCRPCDKPLCFHHTCIRGIGVEDVMFLTMKRLRYLSKEMPDLTHRQIFSLEAQEP